MIVSISWSLLRTIENNELSSACNKYQKSVEDRSFSWIKIQDTKLTHELTLIERKKQNVNVWKANKITYLKLTLNEQKISYGNKK